MSINREISLTIKPTVDATAAARAAAALDKTTKAAQQTHATLTKNTALYFKTSEAIKAQETTLNRVYGKWKLTHTVTEELFRDVRTVGGDALKAIAHGIDGLGEKFKRMGATAKHALKDFGKEFGSGAFRTILGSGRMNIGESLGEGAVELIKTAFEEASQEYNVKQRLGREFGGSFNIDKLWATGGALGKRGGIQGDEMLRGMYPVLEALDDVQAGSMLRVKGKAAKKLTGEEAQSYRDTAVEHIGGLMARLKVLNRDKSIDDIGMIVSEAIQGPEQLMRAAKQLGLNRHKALEFAKQSKEGKITSTAALFKLADEGGASEAAADDARKRFEFQMDSIKSTVKDNLGLVAENAMGLFNKRLGESGSLAEKLDAWLASPAGKTGIEKMSLGLSKLVEKTFELAEQIPRAFKWFEDHQALFDKMGAVAGAIGSAFEKTLTLTGLNTLDKAGDKEETTEERHDRVYAELDQAKHFARLIDAGKMDPEKAAFAFQGFAKSAEGAKDADSLTGMSQRLREQIRTKDTASILAMTGSEAFTQSLVSKDRTPTIHMNINAPVGLTREDIQSMMPAIENELMSKARNTTADGAAGY